MEQKQHKDIVLHDTLAAKGVTFHDTLLGDELESRFVTSAPDRTNPSASSYLPFWHHLSVLNNLFTTCPESGQVQYGERLGAVDKVVFSDIKKQPVVFTRPICKDLAV